MQTRPHFLLAFVALAACEPPTKFTGEAKFPGGKTACEATCRRDNLEIAAFVYSGEFATSCVCRVPSPAAPASPPAAAPPGSHGAEVAPAAGVEVQTQAAAAAAAAANNAHYMQYQMQQQRSRTY